MWHQVVPQWQITCSVVRLYATAIGLQTEDFLAVTVQRIPGNNGRKWGHLFCRGLKGRDRKGRDLIGREGKGREPGIPGAKNELFNVFFLMCRGRNTSLQKSSGSLP